MSQTTSSSSMQIKVTIPAELGQYLTGKASKFGFPVAAYVKYLILNDVKEDEFPVFPLSAKNEEILLQAIEDHKNGKTHTIKNVENFFRSL